MFFDFTDEYHVHINVNHSRAVILSLRCAAPFNYFSHVYGLFRVLVVKRNKASKIFTFLGLKQRQLEVKKFMFRLKSHVDQI